MTAPRLLLVSGVSELEWQIRPALEEWAEVATYDPAGIGENTGDWSIEASVDRGLSTVSDRGWDEYVLVADAWGAWYAVGILEAQPDPIRGFALGHAALSHRMTGERPAQRVEIWNALGTLIAEGRESFARSAISQFTRDGIDEDLAAKIVERVPMPVFEAILKAGDELDYDLGAVLRRLDLPLLFAQHEDCLLYTDEGYEDAVAAFPDAKTASTDRTCPASATFADALREFCSEIYP